MSPWYQVAWHEVNALSQVMTLIGGFYGCFPGYPQELWITLWKTQGRISQKPVRWGFG